MNQSPFFTFTGGNSLFSQGRNSLLFSIPMFAKYSKVPSVRNLGYERVAIRMKKEYDTYDMHRKLLEDIKWNGALD